MELIRNLRSGTSVFPLLSKIGKLDEAPAPATLVDVSLGHKVIAPLQVRQELLELSEIVAALRPTTMLEIGTFRGGTLFVFARLAAPNATLISLDLPISAAGKLIRIAQQPLFNRFTRDKQTLHLLREDSHKTETVDKVRDILQGRLLDFFFIDGDHRYAGVKADFEMYSPFVRPGGVIAFHDINYPRCDVPRFWSEISPRYRSKAIIHKQGPDGMGIGVIWV
jgi:predicted O-methyltransferase YrrM